jgi:hypothetical protein
VPVTALSPHGGGTNPSQSLLKPCFVVSEMAVNANGPEAPLSPPSLGLALTLQFAGTAVLHWLVASSSS